MSKGSTPTPDYAGAAQATAQGNAQTTEQQTWANRPTVNTPFGQQTWQATPTWDPTTGQYINSWETNINLTPDQQSALDYQQQAAKTLSGAAGTTSQQAADALGSPMDYSQFQTFGSTPGVPDYKTQNFQSSLDYSGVNPLSDPTAVRNKAEDALYQRATSRLDPQWSQQEEQLRNRLYNQGLREGDEAYDTALANFGRDKNDAYSSAMNDAISGGGAEASRQFGMDLSARQQGVGEINQQGQFANDAANNMLNQELGIGGQQYNQQMSNSNYQNMVRQQQIAEALQRRTQPLNETQALLNGQQIGSPSMPNFSTASKSSAGDYLGAAQLGGTAAQNAYNAQQANNQGLFTGLASLLAFL